jgi:hypothetical protein
MDSMLIYLPDGSTKSYAAVTDLKSEDGFITFYSKANVQKKITTTLPILFMENLGAEKS